MLTRKLSRWLRALSVFTLVSCQANCNEMCTFLIIFDLTTFLVQFYMLGYTLLTSMYLDNYLFLCPGESCWFQKKNSYNPPEYRFMYIRRSLKIWTWSLISITFRYICFTTWQPSSWNEEMTLYVDTQPEFDPVYLICGLLMTSPSPDWLPNTARRH